MGNLYDSRTDGNFGRKILKDIASSRKKVMLDKLKIMNRFSNRKKWPAPSEAKCLP